MPAAPPNDRGGGARGDRDQMLPFPLARTWGGGGAGAAPKPVQHVLLAEFDINEGCTMRCQFPEPVPGGKEAADALAETMLPEGAHQRERDSLWFFLNRAGRMWDDDEDGPTGKACDSGGAVSRSEATSPPSREDRFLYGFNLVQTHTDTSIRRGARVMALALLSPYPFIQFLAEAAMVHALEECLLLAAASEEAAGEEGQEEVLRRLLACVNGLDLAAVPRPRPVERALMWRGVTARGVHDVGGDAARAYLPQAWVHHTQLTWQRKRRAGPAGSDAAAAAAAPEQQLQQQEKEEIQLPVALPLSLGPDDGAGGRRSLALLLNLLGPPAVSRLLPALLAGQRVLFVGHGHAAADVGRLVLTAGGLLAPPLRGVLRRVFPYATLADTSFLDTPAGYIAGTTNPVFLRREGWWDLLIEVDMAKGKGRCYAPGEREAEENEGGGGSRQQQQHQQRAATPSFSPAPPTPVRSTVMGGAGTVEGEVEAAAEGDAALYARLKAVCSACGGGDRGEEWLRAAVQRHVQALLELAWDGTSPVHNGRARESSRRFARANAQRVRALRRLPEFATANPDPWHGLQPPLPVPGTTLRSHLRLLATHALLADVEMERVFLDLSNALHAPESLCVLLALLPEGGEEEGGGGGLLRLATVLFHENPQVRFHAALLLDRLKACPATRPALAALNPLLLHAHGRVLEEMTAGEGGGDRSSGKSAGAGGRGAL